MKKSFFDWIKQRTDEYAKNRERALKAQATRWANVYAKQNNGDLPTESVSGDGEYRLHAPYDGYVHSWNRGGEDFEAEYLGGQYLPMDSDSESLGWEAFGFDGGKKIWDVPSERAVEFGADFQAAGIDVIEARVSNEYPQRDTHDPVRLVTVSHCPQDILSAIDDYLMGDIYKLQRLAEEKEQSEKDARELAHQQGEEVSGGRQVITGTVLGMKWKSSSFGDTLKMLVQDDRGFRVWGTVAGSLEVNREDRIQFTATVERSDDDPRFGFFKRPAKAINLTDEEAAA